MHQRGRQGNCWCELTEHPLASSRQACNSQGSTKGQRGQRCVFRNPQVTPASFIRTWRCFSALGNVMTHFMMHSHSNYSHSAACVCAQTIDRNMARTGSGWLCWFEVRGRKKNGNYAGVVYKSWSLPGFRFLEMPPPETVSTSSFFTVASVSVTVYFVL